MRQLSAFCVFSAYFHYDSASNLRQNRIFHDVPKRIAQLLLRVALHPIIDFASIRFTDFSPQILPGILAKPQFQRQSLWRNLTGKRGKACLVQTFAHKTVSHHQEDGQPVSCVIK